MSYTKPPIGVMPYYISATRRIEELADAIKRNAATGNYVYVKQWAREIILQIDLFDKMAKGE